MSDHDDARADRPLRCDGTPHPENAIPPLPEHDYRFDGDDPYVVCARCGERLDALTGCDLLAAGRAETTTATTEDAWEVIDRVRDAYPRIPNDAPTDEIVEALADAGLLATARTREGARPVMRPACELPACGCSGEAHP